MRTVKHLLTLFPEVTAPAQAIIVELKTSSLQEFELIEGKWQPVWPAVKPTLITDGCYTYHKRYVNGHCWICTQTTMSVLLRRDNGVISVTAGYVTSFVQKKIISYYFCVIFYILSKYLTKKLHTTLSSASCANDLASIYLTIKIYNTNTQHVQNSITCPARQYVYVTMNISWDS